MLKVMENLRRQASEVFPPNMGMDMFGDAGFDLVLL
jgi:hypothetical protein